MSESGLKVVLTVEQAMALQVFMNTLRRVGVDEWEVTMGEVADFRANSLFDIPRYEGGVGWELGQAYAELVKHFPEFKVEAGMSGGVENT